MPGALARLTVVVPVGPSDRVSPQLCKQLSALPAQAQVHVVGCEATGEAITLSPDASAGPQWQCLLAPRGRASQQNAGAVAATRDWLWFLHADAALAADTLPALARFIDTHAGPDARALGYFDLRFIDDGPALTRLNAWGAHVRSRVFGLPFGDQGLVLPRAAFEALGGFDPGIVCGEDHDLVWRARRAGLPAHAVGAPLYTSARKYAQRGWWPTTAWHLRETWRQARQFSRAKNAL